MISVEEALEKILNRIEVLETEIKPIPDCLGQVLAEDIYSDVDVPPRDNSAFDGFAVRAADTVGASRETPRTLRVIETVYAGVLPRCEVEPGTAVRIMTGAPIPEGADCIIMFEDTDDAERAKAGDLSEVGVMREEKPGVSIRHAGESIARGSLVAAKGAVIRPSEVGVLAAVGCREVKVIRRPVVAIMATGDEIVELGQPLPEGKLYNSNSYSVAAQVMRYGGIPRWLGIAPDDEEKTMAVLQEGLSADILLTIGGVSMGDYDVVRDVLARQGEMVFWKVRTKPGKPLTFGMLRGAGPGGKTGEIPHLGLAGNPVSCMVNFEVFVRPALLKMMGRQNLAKPTVEAVMADRINNKDGRRIFARVIVEKRDGQYFARLTGSQGSGILSSMALANGLAIVPEDRTRVEAGDRLQVMMLDWSEEL